MARVVINLDEMFPDAPEKIIVHKGVEHILSIATTEIYLKVLRARKKLGQIDPTDEAAMTEESIALLSLVLPTFDKKEFFQMKLPRLMKLVELVQEDLAAAEAPTVTPDGLAGDIVDAEVIEQGE